MILRDLWSCSKRFWSTSRQEELNNMSDKRSSKTEHSKVITDPDPAAAKRAFEAMMTMRKINIATIEAARKW